MVAAFDRGAVVVDEVLTVIALLFICYGIGLGDTVVAAVIGHALITPAFVVLTVWAAMSNFDQDLEDAARNLGCQ